MKAASIFANRDFHSTKELVNPLFSFPQFWYTKFSQIYLANHAIVLRFKFALRQAFDAIVVY